MRLGVLDLGSNSFHLSVYRSRGAGSIEKVAGAKEMCRLGAGTAYDGAIDDAALRRGSLAVDRILGEVDRSGVDALTVVATSAIRDADNGQTFCDRLQRRHGISIEVLTGHEEARLVFHGARHGLVEAPQRIAVIDVGGGSGEVVAGVGQRVTIAHSLPVGVLRMRAVHDPEDRTFDRVRRRVRSLGGSAMRAVRRHAPQQIVLASGTARRLFAASGALGIRSAATQSLTRKALRELLAVLPALSAAELDSLGIEAARRDTIAPGAAVLDTLLEMCGASAAVVSRGGLREGVALREASRHSGAVSTQPRRHRGVAASRRVSG